MPQAATRYDSSEETPLTPPPHEDEDLLRARLAAAERVGELLAHELGNMIIVLRTHSDLLAHQWDRLPEAQRRQSAETMDQQMAHLDELLTTLLDTARRRDRARQRLELATFLQRCTDWTARAVGRPGAIELDCPSDLQVTTDPGLLEIAVRNLVANAFVHGEPPVRISARLDGDHFVVRVDDHGPGVPDEFVPFLFERFQRADNSTAGMGLGLSIVRDLLRLDRGVVRFDEPGDGASFVIELPDHTGGDQESPHPSG